MKKYAFSRAGLTLAIGMTTFTGLGVGSAALSSSAQAETIPMDHYVVGTWYTSEKSCESYGKTFKRANPKMNIMETFCFENNQHKWTLAVMFPKKSGGGSGVRGVGRAIAEAAEDAFDDIF